MKRLRLVRKLIAALVKDRLRHPGRLAAETLILTARCGVLLLVYRTVFDLHAGTIHGTSYAVAAWSMFLYFAFSALRLRDVVYAIMHDVRSGNVEILLSKPVSYLPYRLWWQLGAGLYPAFVITLVGALALAATIGFPASMRTGLFLPTLALAAVGGTVLSLLLYALVGLSAFWIEDASPLHWVVDKSVMVLGGSYLPVALFPPSLYQVARYSPLGASQFVTHTVNDSWAADWPRLLAIQLGWILVLGLAVSWMYRRARRRVSINGG